jgi:hypothetical protein
MTRYNHEIDWLIVNELLSKGSLTCTQLYDSLKKPDVTNKVIRYATVWEHLERLSKPEMGIVNKDDTPGPNNEKRYSPTPATKFQLEYGIFDSGGFETKREDPAKKQETRQRKYTQILTRILLQAAAGTSWYKEIEVDEKSEEETKPKLL